MVGTIQSGRFGVHAPSALAALGATHYFPLDEAAGTVAHDRIGSSVGTYTGTYTLGAAGPNGGKAVDLGGGYVDITHDGSLTPFNGASGAGTVVLFVRPDALSATQMLMTKYGDWQMRIESTDGKLLWDVSQSTAVSCMATNAVTNYQIEPLRWQMIAGTYDRTVPRLRSWNRATLDEVDTSATGNVAGAGNNVQIGRRADGGGTVFDGRVAHFIMFPFELTLNQLDQVGDIIFGLGANATALHAAQIADGASLVYPFDEISGGAQDLSGNGFHATVLNFPLFRQEALRSGARPSMGFPGAGGSGGAGQTLAYVGSHAPGTGDFAIEFWYQSAYSGADYSSIFDRDVGESGNGLLLFTQITSGVIRMWCAGSVRTGGVSLLDGVPHHVVVTRISGVVRLWIDGVQDATFGNWSNSGNCNGSGSPGIYIGKDSMGVYGSKGASMQDFAYYPATGLSGAQVANHIALA